MNEGDSAYWKSLCKIHLGICINCLLLGYRSLNHLYYEVNIGNKHKRLTFQILLVFNLQSRIMSLYLRSLEFTKSWNVNFLTNWGEFKPLFLQIFVPFYCLLLLLTPAFLCFCFFLKKLYFTWKQSYREGEIHIDFFHLLLYSPDDCNTLLGTMLKAGAWDSIQVSHIGDRDPRTWVISYILCDVRRELDRNWMSQDSKQCSRGMLVLQA